MTAVDRPEPAQPPYVRQAVTDRHGVGARIRNHLGIEMIEIAVHGEWSPSVSDTVAAVLPRYLAGPWASIIVDLGGLVDTYGASLPFWLALWRRARLAETPVNLTFCLPETTALSRRLQNRQGPQPRVFTTVREARTATAARLARTGSLQPGERSHPP